MSSYNGAQHVERQIESILRQENVEVHLTIRDDGSCDDTLSILRSIERRFPTQIAVWSGENVGYKRSFLMLLAMAQDADYYAFSDQDDLWEPNKLSAALAMIHGKEKVLYVSNLTICNPELQVLGKTTFRRINSSIYSNFTRHRYAGCTYVFDRRLKQIVSVFSYLVLPVRQMPSHDALVCRCAYACGEVVLDEQSYIKHIRYADSVTAGGNGLFKRIKMEWRGVISPAVTSNTAKLILECLAPNIRAENVNFLQQVASYKQSFAAWTRLLCNPKMRCGIFVCDLKCKLQIAVRTY